MVSVVDIDEPPDAFFAEDAVFLEDLISVLRRDVLIIFRLLHPRIIEHAEFLAFIDERRSSEGEIEQSEHLAAFFPMMSRISEPVDRAGLIVVFQIVRVPGDFLLPAIDFFHEFLRGEMREIKRRGWLSDSGCIELEKHVEFLIEEFSAVRIIHVHRFADHDAIVMLEDIAPEFFEDVVIPWP